MDYIRSYKNFISSYQLTEGLRKTAGILIPPFLLAWLGYFDIGIVMAIGALCISTADNPGSILHQRNGLLVANAVIFFTAIITGIAAHSAVLLGVVLLLLSFLFSMLAIYGNRVNSIGLAGLVVMTLNIFELHQGWDILWNALYLLAGGGWYLLLTLVLYSFRPYKATKQMLGDMVQSMAAYLASRAAFYEKGADQETVFKRLFHEQVQVQEKHDLVGDMIFKTRSIARESTHTGRMLMVIYLDATLLFERITTSYQDYRTLHKFFDETHILDRYKELILLLGSELQTAGIAIQAGEVSKPSQLMMDKINEVKEALTRLRHSFMKPDNIEGFIYLRNIINNIQDIAERINRLHQYTSFDSNLKVDKASIEHEKLISHQDYSPRLFLANMSLKSDIFRHALRVSLAVLTGYIIGEAFTIGHSYWILLTIIIILKPAYSLTKQRNYDRLEGTTVGLFMGVIILLLVKNITLLMVILVLLMAISNSLTRVHYFWSVAFMTPYVLIFLNFLYGTQFTTLLLDRFIDTALGSVIAFIASFFLLPNWEREKMRHFMLEMLKQNRAYFLAVRRQPFDTGQVLTALIKARKEAMVALSNLTGTFNRMLSEPKNRQMGLQQVHQFIVLNHMLIAHLASLTQQLQDYRYQLEKEVLDNVVSDIDRNFEKAITNLEGSTYKGEEPNPQRALKLLNQQANELMDKRRKEVEARQVETDTLKPLLKMKSVVNQYNFIYNMAADLEKVSHTLKNQVF